MHRCEDGVQERAVKSDFNIEPIKSRYFHKIKDSKANQIGKYFNDVSLPPRIR